MLKIRYIVQFLEGLGIKYPDQEVIGFVIVRNDAEHRRFAVRVIVDAFSDGANIDVIIIQDPEDLRVLQKRQPCMRRYDDRPDRILCAGSYFLIGNPCRMVFREHVHQFIKRRLLPFLLRNLRHVQKAQHFPHVCLPPVFRALIPHIGEDGLEIQRQGVLPERIRRVRSFRQRVCQDVGYQFYDVIVRADICKRVVMVRFCHIHQVDRHDPVAECFQHVPELFEKFCFGIGEDHGCLAPEGVYQDIEKGLAGSGAADREHVIVQLRIETVQAHGQVLGEDLVKLRVLRVCQFPADRFRVSQPGGSVFQSRYEVPLFHVEAEK